MSSGSCMASPSLYPTGGEAQGGAAARGRGQPREGRGEDRRHEAETGPDRRGLGVAEPQAHDAAAQGVGGEQVRPRARPDRRRLHGRRARLVRRDHAREDEGLQAHPLLQGVLGDLSLGLLRLGQADGDRHAHRAAQRGGHDDGHQRHAVGVGRRHVDLVRHLQVEDRYEKRVSDMMGAMLKGGARRVYWVGMPMMGEAWRNSRMKLIDKIIQNAAAQHPGAEYVDAWGLFVDSNQDYVADWRLADGVHFTVEGQQRLAKAVLKDIEKDWLPDGLPSPSPSSSPSSSASAGPSI